ncbi:MAG: GNAT family N-acetyltransferase [Bacteroidota bacterium]
MIERLDNTNQVISERMHALFQASYTVEADLLKAIDFPPLKRPLHDFLKSDTAFYGLWENEEIAAIVEIRVLQKVLEIQSLVVHPNYFRQGLGRKLMMFILDTFDAEIYTVETGLENKPATQLYKKLGFQEVKQWDTAFGIRKVKFELTKK